ncbi:MAG: phosphopantothenoylcysteine decarboxylase / phosphopantothenate---cysteine ligase [Verrucomicrobiota bacterium]
MGYAIATAALENGHDVVLISGPVSLPSPAQAKRVNVITSDEMYQAVQRAARDCDVLVMCAAVADYKPRRVAKQKIKKQDKEISLDLVPTRDILKSLPQKRDYLVVGFAAETKELEKHAREKLRHKNCDIIVANDVSDPAIGMGSDENAVTIFFRDGKMKKISRSPKEKVARRLVKIILKNAKRF